MDQDRSLGRHTRRQVPPPAGGGYGLREKPKKKKSFDDLGGNQCSECGREFKSCRALFGHMRFHSQRPQRVKEEDYARLLNKKQKMALSEYPKEQVDGALVLMMLSRDKGNLGNGISGFSDKSFANQQESVFDDNGDGSLKKKKKKNGSNGFEAGVLGYQCLICGAEFRSGQALGGHKRAHWAKATPRIVYDDADLCRQRVMI